MKQTFAARALLDEYEAVMLALGKTRDAAVEASLKSYRRFVQAAAKRRGVKFKRTRISKITTKEESP